MPSDSVSESTVSEYRINVSSDTPHWYIMDYLTRSGGYYAITSANVGGNVMWTITLHIVFMLFSYDDTYYIKVIVLYNQIPYC